jgi:hypothetical protein
MACHAVSLVPNISNSFSQPPLQTVEPAEPSPAHVYDDPAHTPDFDAIRESFQQGKIVIRVEPKREARG